MSSAGLSHGGTAKVGPMASGRGNSSSDTVANERARPPHIFRARVLSRSVATSGKLEGRY